MNAQFIANAQYTTNTQYITYVVLLVGGVMLFNLLMILFYKKVLAPRSKAKREKKYDAFKSEFLPSIQGREIEAKADFILNDPYVNPFLHQIQDDLIIGIVSCFQIKGLKDLFKTTASDMVGHAVGRVVGLGWKEKENSNDFYLVLTNKHLHYLQYDEEDGACLEHYQFERDNMTNIECGALKQTDSIKHNVTSDQAVRLSFVSKEVNYKFFFLESMQPHPAGEDNYKLDQDYVYKLKYFFSDPFAEFANQYRK